MIIEHVQQYNQVSHCSGHWSKLKTMLRTLTVGVAHILLQGSRRLLCRLLSASSSAVAEKPFFPPFCSSSLEEVVFWPVFLDIVCKETWIRQKSSLGYHFFSFCKTRKERFSYKFIYFIFKLYGLYRTCGFCFHYLYIFAPILWFHNNKNDTYV